MPEREQSASNQHMIPFIFEEGGCKSLHFSMEQLQSRMCIDRPYDLIVDYTKAMTGFLLLNSQPEHIAMIGLGGGSLAKYCYRKLPETKITVVEINPHVIALRNEFLVPEDDDRFRVIETDGAEYVAVAEPDVDVLLVDGYDDQGQPAQLCSQRFYDDCDRLLTKHGVMVVNMHDTHPLYELFIDRIDRTFDGNFVEVATNHDGNIVVIAQKEKRISQQHLRSDIYSAYQVWDDWSSLSAEMIGSEEVSYLEKGELS